VRSPAQILGGRVGEIARAVAILLAIFIGMRSLIQTFRVDGPSMTPNLETGQRLLVNRVAYLHTDGTPFEGLLPDHRQGSVAYLFGGPRRGDVVVLRPPGESGFDADLVKRIIGLPGDTVAIQDGRVYVNGDELTEPYVRFAADYSYPGEGLAILVPNDSYFVLGDNRPISSDSHLGWLVPADKLVGQAWLSYWPMQRFGLVI
jgi:signal peptidase I